MSCNKKVVQSFFISTLLKKSRNEGEPSPYSGIPYLDGFTVNDRIQQLDMRRKAEILKYNKNTQPSGGRPKKSENWVRSVANIPYINTIARNTQIATEDSNCPGKAYPSSSSDVPGKIIMLYEPSGVPLYNYAFNTANRTSLEESETETQYVYKPYIVSPSLNPIISNFSVPVLDFYTNYNAESGFAYMSATIPVFTFIRYPRLTNDTIVSVSITDVIIDITKLDNNEETLYKTFPFKVNGTSEDEYVSYGGADLLRKYRNDEGQLVSVFNIVELKSLITPGSNSTDTLALEFIGNISVRNMMILDGAYMSYRVKVKTIYSVKVGGFASVIPITVQSIYNCPQWSAGQYVNCARKEGTEAFPEDKFVFYDYIVSLTKS